MTDVKKEVKETKKETKKENEGKIYDTKKWKELLEKTARASLQNYFKLSTDAQLDIALRGIKDMISCKFATAEAKKAAVEAGTLDISLKKKETKKALLEKQKELINKLLTLDPTNLQEFQAVKTELKEIQEKLKASK